MRVLDWQGKPLQPFAFDYKINFINRTKRVERLYSIPGIAGPGCWMVKYSSIGIEGARPCLLHSFHESSDGDPTHDANEAGVVVNPLHLKFSRVRVCRRIQRSKPPISDTPPKISSSSSSSSSSRSPVAKVYGYVRTEERCWHYTHRSLNPVRASEHHCLRSQVKNARRTSLKTPTLKHEKLSVYEI